MTIAARESVPCSTSQYSICIIAVAMPGLTAAELERHHGALLRAAPLGEQPTAYRLHAQLSSHHPAIQVSLSAVRHWYGKYRSSHVAGESSQRCKDTESDSPCVEETMTGAPVAQASSSVSKKPNGRRRAATSVSRWDKLEKKYKKQEGRPMWGGMMQCSQATEKACFQQNRV